MKKSRRVSVRMLHAGITDRDVSHTRDTATKMVIERTERELKN